NYHKNEFGNITSEILDLTKVINKQAKIFRQQYEDISQKTETVLLSDICYISKGMVVNADEHTAKNEFVKSDIVSAQKTKIFNKPYIEGKDLKHYLLERIRFLEWGTERVPAKLSRVTFPSLYTGEKIMRGRVTGGIYENTGLVCNDSIILFKKFIDLQNVKSRSISVSISKNHFEKFGSKTSEEIAKKREELEEISTKFELKYLLAIINSKYAYWFLNNFRRSSIKNYFYPDDFRNLPIPLISDQDQQIFVEKVDLMMSKGRELQTLQSDWFVLLPKKLKPKKKLTKKLANWFLGDFEFFVAEMLKVGIDIGKLDYKERQKLKTDFSFAQADALPLHNLLEKTDQQIDVLVYKLYNLSSEEINLIENKQNYTQN
ncbi:MAG: hypothetical protein EAZ97_02010, partial [Bacteroidetes bacterium]